MQKFSQKEKEQLVQFIHSETLERIDAQNITYKKRRFYNLLIVAVTLSLLQVCISVMGHTAIIQELQKAAEINGAEKVLFYLISNYSYFAISLVFVALINFCIYSFMIKKNIARRKN